MNGNDIKIAKAIIKNNLTVPATEFKNLWDLVKRLNARIQVQKVVEGLAPLPLFENSCGGKLHSYSASFRKDGTFQFHLCDFLNEAYEAGFGQLHDLIYKNNLVIGFTENEAMREAFKAA